MADDTDPLPNLLPDAEKILENSMTDSCSILVMKSLDKSESSFRRIEKGVTFRRVSGKYQIDQANKGSDLIFGIASQTKILIALVLFLVFKEIPNVDPNDYWNITFTELFNKNRKRFKLKPLPGNPTVKDLLVHRCGVPDINDFLLAPDGTPLLSKESFARILPEVCTNTIDGDDRPVKYSNGNFVLLALLIEEIKGRSFEDCLKTYVLIPLEMGRTFCAPITIAEDESNWAYPFVVYEDGVPRRARDRLISSDSAASAVMGIYSCTRDMGKLYEAFFDALQGKPRIRSIDESVVKQMFGFEGEPAFFSSISNDEQVGYTACGLVSSSDSQYIGFHSLNRLILKNDESTAFNLGEGEELKKVNGKLFCQAGTVTGYSCCTYLIPSLHEAVIVMTNTVGSNDAADHLARRILQELYDLRVSPESRQELPGQDSEKPDCAAKAQRSAERIHEQWQEREIRKPSNTTPIRYPERLVGKYRGDYEAQNLTITSENGDTNVVISDGSRHSDKLRLKRMGSRKFRVIPEATGVDVFGSWDVLELVDESPKDANEVTRLSRLQRTSEGEEDRHYRYELIPGSRGDQ